MEERERARRLSRGIQGFGRSDSSPAAPVDSSETPRETCRPVLSLQHDHDGRDHDHDQRHQEKAKIKRYPGKENDVGKTMEKAITDVDASRPLLRHRGATELRRTDHPVGFMKSHAACV